MTYGVLEFQVVKCYIGHFVAGFRNASEGEKECNDDI